MNRTFFDWVIYVIEHYGSWLIKGAGVTMLVALTGTIIGLTIGLAIGIVRTIPSDKSKDSGDTARRGVKAASVALVLALITAVVVLIAHFSGYVYAAVLIIAEFIVIAALAVVLALAARVFPVARGIVSMFRKGILSIANVALPIYIEVFRGTPMIVQAMVIYYGLAEGMGIDIAPIPAGIFIVSINTGAYMAEIVRGGIQSIDPGQTEAAHAIGMTHWQTMLNVILPQTIRNILPATGNEFVINIKDTSVLNVISVTELFFSTKSIKGAIYRTYEPFLVAAAIYLVLTFTVTRILRMLERKMDGASNFTLVTSSTMPDNIIKRAL